MNIPPKTFDKNFIRGVILMAIGTVLAFTFYLALLGIPILLFGLWFVWQSKKSGAVKMVLTVAPIILFAAVLWLLPGGSYRTDDADVELYCIPEHYRGRVVVIFDETCGERRTALNYVEYHIPFYGTYVVRHKLRQQAERRFQFINPDNGYFLNKEVKLLQTERNMLDTISDGVYVSQLSTGSGQLNGDRYEYLTFIVDSLRGPRAERASLKYMIDVTLNACRDHAAKKRKGDRPH